MKTFIFFVLLILGAAAGLWFAGEQATAANTIRLKATATVLVDGVERTGSAVQEFRLQWRHEPQVGNNGTWQTLVRGEAIRIDVPNEEPIYVLIGAGTLFNNCLVRPGDTDDAFRDRFRGLKRCEVTKLFPTTIRFDGSGKYQEAIAVHVAGKDWNGYQFAAMHFERTDETVTEGRSPPNPWPDLDGPIKVHAGSGVHSISKGQFKLENFR